MQDRAANWVPELSLMEFTGSVTSELPTLSGLDGASERLERIRGRAELLSRNGFSAAFVTGEAGTGKHRLARWMHGQTRRGNRPLISVDAARPRALEVVQRLIQSTSSPDASPEIQPGNLVVENLQRASTELAQALVEFLAAQGLELRCGLILLSTEPVSLLRAMSIEHGRLLGRSASAIVEIPPLRERIEDIPMLARVFLDEAARYYGRVVRGLSPQALARLQQHTFPGNTRELRAVVEQSLLRSNGDWVTVDDLPLPARPTENGSQAEVIIRLPGSSLREIELQAIRLALRLASGRLVRASELLGITRHALRRKLEKYGLNELRARPPNEGEDEDDLEEAFI